MNIFSSVSDVLDKIGKGVLISFVNPFSYCQVRNSKYVVNGIDGFGFDGFILKNIYNVLMRSDSARLSFDFTCLADPVFSYCENNNKSVAIVGSDEISLQNFKKIISRKYPILNIVYCRNGYMDDIEREGVLACIAAASPDVLVCGMGALIQERFLVDARNTGWCGTGFTCGGFIHQTAAKGGTYYPVWVDRLNLRFLFRIWDEPKLIKRYAFFYPQGIFYFIKDCLIRYEKTA